MDREGESASAVSNAPVASAKAISAEPQEESSTQPSLQKLAVQPSAPLSPEQILNALSSNDLLRDQIFSFLNPEDARNLARVSPALHSHWVPYAVPRILKLNVNAKDLEAPIWSQYMFNKVRGLELCVPQEGSTSAHAKTLGQLTEWFKVINWVRTESADTHDTEEPQSAAQAVARQTHPVLAGLKVLRFSMGQWDFNFHTLDSQLVLSNLRELSVENESPFNNFSAYFANYIEACKAQNSLPFPHLQKLRLAFKRLDLYKP